MKRTQNRQVVIISLVLVILLLFQVTAFAAEPENEMTIEVIDVPVEELEVAESITEGMELKPAPVYKAESAPVLHKLTGLKATNLSYNKIRLTWNRVNGADGYRVTQYIEMLGMPIYSGTITVTENNCVFENLEPKENYSFSVYAYVRGSYNLEVISEAAQIHDVKVILPAPKNFMIKSADKKTRKVKLIWDALEGASGYHIYKSANPKDGFTHVKSLGGNGSRSLNIYAFKGKTTYYRIAAYRGTYQGKYSGTINIRMK